MRPYLPKKGEPGTPQYINSEIYSWRWSISSHLQNREIDFFDFQCKPIDLESSKTLLLISVVYKALLLAFWCSVLMELVQISDLWITRVKGSWAAWREKVPNILRRCHTKRRTGARPSFGMTPTQDIRDLFVITWNVINLWEPVRSCQRLHS